MQKKLFIVSNRLPITVELKDNNHYVSRQSSGGLISAISAYLNKEGKDKFTQTIWAGIPDCSEKAWNNADTHSTDMDYTYLPVFVNRKKYELYYNGFSNSLLWPLFHYFPSFADYNPSYYKAYTEINEIFAQILAAQLKKEDVVWIHDYHLLPLAGMLRKMFPTLTIGFFLHIPFPSYELFRVIPKQWQREILSGMMGADLIGFHTVDYANHFLSCVETALKTEHDGQYILWKNRKVKADAFPISIDFDLFNGAYDNPETSKIRDQYLEMKGNRKLLFSVDRLDYTKGVSCRLKGYEQFLKENPEYIGKVIFVLVIVPSRDSISKYAERKKMIDEYISHINSKLGSIVWQPIIYQYGHLSFEELTALYTACDIALITPLRDGMNLVSKEFAASRKNNDGVLILSEMAGAARELTDALLINPNDVHEIASMIKYGLEMSPEDQEERMRAMRLNVSRYNVNVWAADFFGQLKDVKELQLAFEVKFLDNVSKIDLLDKYAHAARRLILLDYDGSLVPFSKLPSLAQPGNNVIDILRQLSDNPKNDVFIISGRDSITLEKWLGHLPIGLVAEHGAKIRDKNGSWKTEAVVSAAAWKPAVEKIMERYVAKCPNSFIEEKEFSLAWHYRNADIVQGGIRAKELFENLLDCASHASLNVLNGNKVIEVRNKGVNKGMATEQLIDSANYEFVLSIGDDKTDEDMFAKLAKLPEAFTIKVGNEASFAKYNLHNPYMVQTLLEGIAQYTRSYSIEHNLIERI